MLGVRNEAKSGPSHRDVYIAVMGVTGTGKSTFISLCTEQEVKIGRTLQACTQDVNEYICKYDSRTTVHLIDTPGFDDTTKTNTLVLNEIAAWLVTTYQRNIKLNGVIYLHNIAGVLMQDSSIKSLTMLKSLCGPDAIKNVILVTTFWENVTVEDGSDREAQLKKSPDFWGKLCQEGCQVVRHHNTRASAMKILDIFASQQSKMSKVVLELQSEIVDQGRRLKDTQVGRTAAGEEALEKVREENVQMRAHMESAIEHHDQDRVKIIEQYREELHKKITALDREFEEQKAKLQWSFEEKVTMLEKDAVALQDRLPSTAQKGQVLPSGSSRATPSQTPKSSETDRPHWGPFPNEAYNNMSGPQLAERLQHLPYGNNPYPRLYPSAALRTMESHEEREEIKVLLDMEYDLTIHPPKEMNIDLDDIIRRLRQDQNEKGVTEKEVHVLCWRARRQLLSERTLLRLKTPLIVIGDIRGQYNGLLHLFEYGGTPPSSRYLFLGNYLEVNGRSLLTILLLLAYKCKYPDKVFLMRGCHETREMSYRNRFYDTCQSTFKDGVDIWLHFNAVFDCLPFAARFYHNWPWMPGDIFAVSGGLSPALEKVEDLDKVSRPTKVPKEGLLNDLLWSDPDNNAKGWSRNINRNGSYTFGRDIIKKFVKSNGLAWVIRSHQLQPEGQKLYAGGRLVSIWSAENYRDEFDNRPAFVWIEDTRTVKIPKLPRITLLPSERSKAEYDRSWQFYSDEKMYHHETSDGKTSYQAGLEDGMFGHDSGAADPKSESLVIRTGRVQKICHPPRLTSSSEERFGDSSKIDALKSTVVENSLGFKESSTLGGEMSKSTDAVRSSIASRGYSRWFPWCHDLQAYSREVSRSGTL